MPQRFLIFLLVCSVAVVAYAGPRQLPTQSYPLKLEKGYTATQTFLGRVFSQRATKLSFDLSGLIKRFDVNDGHFVHKGEIIAALDTSRLQEKAKILQAQIKGIVADLNLAKLNAGRLRKLSAKNYASKQRLDTEETRVSKLSAELLQAQARLRLTQLDIEKSILHAPYAGSIVAEYAEVGSYVSAGSPVVRLQQKEVDEIHVGVPKKYLPYFSKGESHTFYVDGESVIGRVNYTLRHLSSDTQTVRIIFKVTSKEKLIGGESVKLKFSYPVKAMGAWAPLNALTQGIRGTWLIYVLQPLKNQKTFLVEAVHVDVLYSAGDKVYVKGDLKSGMQVVAAGLQKYVPGQIVQ